MSDPTVLIASDHPATGPHGLVWREPGDVVECPDLQVAREILAQPGFSEVIPDGVDHPVVSPTGQHRLPLDPDGTGEGADGGGPDRSDDDPSDSDKGPARPGGTRAKSERSKAITEQAG